jgi:maleylacetate reductase
VPEDELVRAELLQSAVLAARVLQRTGPGPHQAIVQLVGGRTGAPHGVLSAILLPHTLAREAATEPGPFDRLAGELGTDDAAAWAAELVERTGLPSRLAALGIDQDDLDAVARLSQSHPAIAAAGVREQWTEADVVALLAGAW